MEVTTSARFLFAGVLFTWVLSVGCEKVTDNVMPCEFPAIFNFGDSNSDTGAISAAFYPRPPPNGVTFFRDPAGRVCDGRLVIDFIGN